MSRCSPGPLPLWADALLFAWCWLAYKLYVQWLPASLLPPLTAAHVLGQWAALWAYRGSFAEFRKVEP